MSPQVPQSRRTVTRVQTGVRIEKRILLVLKALASTLDLSLGDLLEGVVLHAFEGKAPFSAQTLANVEALKTVYGLDLSAEDSHLLVEKRTKIASKKKGREAKKP
ncbi:MAG TPA: hypothetical protein VG496_00740 [Myxococcales bacterium]|nr:hypothetical protein [Myxococcales bacterium]